MSPIRRRAMRAGAVAAAVALTLTACGDDDGTESGGQGGDAGDVAAALEEGGELTIWSWEGTLEQVVDDFNAKYPQVDVELVNAGSGNDHYTALQNAIQAGSGGPDIAQVEYFAVPQFAMRESLVDLSQFGAADLAEDYTPGTWSSVNLGDAVYGLPMDSGPIALYYNKTVFDTYGIEVPETWDEFVQAGRDLKAAGSTSYITYDLGNAGLTQAIIWQGGGRPWQVDDTTVTIDFEDQAVQRYAQMWQQLIDEDLLAPIDAWTDEWYQGLGDGTIAALVAGAWMPANLESGVAQASGEWRVAPVPQWEAGDQVSAEHGGSSLAVMKDSANPALAYAFLEYANHADGVQTRVDLGAFPAATAPLESDEFLGDEFEYFGGQKANEIFVESASSVPEGWTFLPFQVYANSVFNDTVGQAYVSDTTMGEGLAAWREVLLQYGSDQGFTMK